MAPSDTPSLILVESRPSGRSFVHETTVRFTDELWTRVRHTSAREGISAAQYVRDATVARIAVEEHAPLLRIEVTAALRALDRRTEQIEHALRRHGLR